ncbi:unnamed protein product, partial [marine sediment metagenome]
GDKIGRLNIMAMGSTGMIVQATLDGTTAVVIKVFFNELGVLDTNAGAHSRRLFDHERKVYRTLAGVLGLPQYYGHVVDAGRLDVMLRGAPAIVIGLVHGLPLSQRLAAGDLDKSPVLASKVLAATNRVVAAMHRRGVVHRGLSPDNIVILAGSNGEVAILDLAIAMREGSFNDVSGPFAINPDTAGPAVIVDPVVRSEHDWMAVERAFGTQPRADGC